MREDLGRGRVKMTLILVYEVFIQSKIYYREFKPARVYETIVYTSIAVPDNT